MIGTPHQLRRLLDWVILLSTVAFAIIGVALLINRTSYDDYLVSPCSVPRQALTQRCYTEQPVTVVRTYTEHPFKGGPTIPYVVADYPGAVPNQFTVSIERPPQAYYNLKPGKVLMIKVWDDMPTAFYTDHNALAMRTQYNPLTLQDLELNGAVALFAVALVMLVAHPPLWVFGDRVRGSHHLFEGMRRSFGPPDHDFAYGPLRLALVILVLLNLLDVLTSVIGGQVGLYEGNPIAAAMITAWGPLGGFFVLKLPATLMIAIAASKLPRKLAVATVYAASIALLLVVADNVWQEIPRAGDHVAVIVPWLLMSVAR